MRVYLLRLMCLLIAFIISACNQANNDVSIATASEQYPLLEWSKLTPDNWDAMALLKDIDLSNMEDGDPRAFDLLKDVREQWNSAPVNPDLEGKAITIKGYVAPLDGDAGYTKTFLLVPYFGACIHSPPPPSNQVLYVELTGKGMPLSNWDTYVSVSGSLVVAQTDSALGTAGYQMKADIVQPATEEAP